MRASTRYLKSLLRNICWAAEEAGQTPQEALKAALQAAMKPSVAGRYLTHTSVGGQSVSYQLPPSTDLTSQDISDATEFLYELYELAICTLPTDPEPTDKEICAWMMANIRSISVVHPNFFATSMR